MENTWLSLIPPLIVLLVAFISKRILTSLILGILSASLIFNDFFLIKSFVSIFNETFDQLKDIQNYFFFGLIFILGIIIVLIEKTGGAQALGKIITKKAQSKKTVESSCFLLSILLSVDDYLNVLTVGNVMRPVTDKFHIPRVKLAYLTATMAAPLVMLIPFSTWIGFIIGQLNAAGISLEKSINSIIITDPLFVYLRFIPFVFYSFIIIAANWLIVNKKISFGYMKEQEKIAIETGNLFGGKHPHKPEIILEKEKNTSISDFLLPIIIFISIILIGMPYSGDLDLFGGANSFTQAIQKANAPLVLFIASIISLIISIIFAFIRKKIVIKEVPSIIKQGILMMYTSIIMILLAWIFGGFLKQLQTGSYIANLLIGTINISLIPLMIFITSMVVTLAIGSTWGTIAIMIPIVVSIFPPLLNLTTPASIEAMFILIPTLAAVFSGALAGNHLSPISDSTIMSCASTGAYIMDLVKARFWYILAAVTGTCLAYLITGLLINYNIYFTLLFSISSGIILTYTILKTTQFFFNK